MSGDALWEDQGSIFRPSYSATWLNCSGSLRPSMNTSERGSIYAAQGTVFHWLMAEWQTVGRPDHWLGQVLKVADEFSDDEGFDITVDEDMFFYGEECLERYAHFPGDRLIEQSVDISDITPISNQKGTADLVICEPGILRNVDWKYGLGVKVYAKWNEQELCYAWGNFKKWDWKYHFDIIELHIAQPRLHHFDVFELTREELINWADWARNRAAAAWKPKADRTPSPKACQWCKVRVDCAAMEALRQLITDDTFDAAIGEPEFLSKPMTQKEMTKIVAVGSTKRPTLSDPTKMPTEQLARILTYRPLMESWFKQMSAELVTRGLDGEDLGELWRIVEGRTKRRWRNEEVAGEKLYSLGIDPEAIWQRKLVSPRQVEKLLRAVGVRGRLMSAYMKTLVVKPEGKPTLAPAGDNRLSLPNPADETFEVEDEDDSL